MVTGLIGHVAVGSDLVSEGTGGRGAEFRHGGTSPDRVAAPDRSESGSGSGSKLASQFGDDRVGHLDGGGRAIGNGLRTAAEFEHLSTPQGLWRR